MKLFPRSFNQSFATQRPSGTGVRRGPPVPYLTDVRCSPFVPVDLESRQEALKIDQSGFSVDGDIFSVNADVDIEDHIILNGIEYIVVGVAQWTAQSLDVLALQIRVRKYQGK